MSLSGESPQKLCLSSSVSLFLSPFRIHTHVFFPLFSSLSAWSSRGPCSWSRLCPCSAALGWAAALQGAGEGLWISLKEKKKEIKDKMKKKSVIPPWHLPLPPMADSFLSSTSLTSSRFSLSRPLRCLLFFFSVFFKQMLAVGFDVRCTQTEVKMI